MVDGEKLGNVGFQYLGVPYSQMDCQAFVEQCLRDCGMNKNLAGSNAWFREVMKNGAIMTPEACVKQLGTVPKGAFLFIWANDGGEPAKYKPDGYGNASHIGICTGTRGEGAIHSSKSRGCVAESKFKNKTISGGWNRVGLWDQVVYDYGGGTSPQEPETPAEKSLPTLRRGDKGEYVTLLQTMLIQRGYDLAPWGADGDFGKKTDAAVRAFQRDNGLEDDGICGSKTWNALQSNKTPLFTVTIQHVSKTVAEEILSKFGGVMTAEQG